MKAANFLLLFGVSAALALYATWARSQRPEGGPPVAYGDAGGIPLVRAAEAERLWRQPGTLFVDVRTTPEFAHGHIPGALHLPEEELEKRFPAMRERLASASVVVVYCGSRDCGKSLWAAIRLRNEGLRRTVIFPEGWNEWESEGWPAARGGD